MLVAMCLVPHVVVEFAVGRTRTSELKLAAGLLRRLPLRSLLVLDRGCLGYAPLHDLVQQGQAQKAALRISARVQIVERAIGRLMGCPSVDGRNAVGAEDWMPPREHRRAGDKS